MYVYIDHVYNSAEFFSKKAEVEIEKMKYYI